MYQPYICCRLQSCLLEIPAENYIQRHFIYFIFFIFNTSCNFMKHKNNSNNYSTQDVWTCGYYY